MPKQAQRLDFFFLDKMSDIYHSNILGFCVGAFGPLVGSVGFDARPGTILEPLPRVQAVNACLRVTVNPSACTTKKPRKPQPCYPPPLWSFQVATEPPPKLWSPCVGEVGLWGRVVHEQSSMDPWCGCPVSPCVPEQINTQGSPQTITSFIKHHSNGQICPDRYTRAIYYNLFTKYKSIYNTLTYIYRHIRQNLDIITIPTYRYRLLDIPVYPADIGPKYKEY